MTTCRVCQRPLTSPRAVESGIGPTCLNKLGLSYKKAPRRPRSAPRKPEKRRQDVETPMLPFDETMPVRSEAPKAEVGIRTSGELIASEGTLGSSPSHRHLSVEQE